MTLISDFFQTSLVLTIGQTLLHSLWQAMVVALILAALLQIFRNANAQLRYALAITALSACILLPVVSYTNLAQQASAFISLMAQHQAVETTQPNSGAPLLDAGQITSIVSGTSVSGNKLGDSSINEPRRTVEWRGFVNTVLPWAAVFWLVGVLVLSFRLVLGLRLVYKLRTQFVSAVPAELESVACRLARNLRLKQQVDLRASRVVDVPLVVGYLKPLILVPTSTITALSLPQLEMLLAHELAHIRRLDHLINLLQNTVETLLFFHPAVWWISAQVRQERECCCDDLAVRTCGGDALGYAQALAKLDGARPSQRAALAAGGGSLLGRILRLSGKSSAPRFQPTHWLVGVMLIALPMFIASFATAQTQGGTLRIAYTSIQQLDPYKSANNDEANAFSLVFDPLIIISNDNFKPIPHLAESWETPDDTTWIFHLREGVTFQDGNEVFPEGANREVTAEDVVYSINRFLEVSTAFTIGDIESVRALDRYTVEIKTPAPDPFLLSDSNRLARVNIVPREAVEQLGEEGFARNPIGSGPFELTSWNLGETLTFERNEDYWLPVNLDGVEFVFIPDPTVQTIALESGDVDVISYIFNIDSVSLLAENPDLVLLERGGSYRGLGFNVTTPPFNEFAVRDAISKAINIDAAVNAVVVPFGERAYGQVPPWTEFEQDPRLAELWEYNPEAALEQLAEVGFVDSNGDGILDRDGQPLSFDIKTIAGSQVRVLTILVTQLQELGIDANILQQDVAVWAEDLQNGTDTGLFFDYSFAGTTGLYSLFHSSNIGLTNTHFYSNPKVDTLLDEASHTLDYETRNRLWLEAQRLIMRDRAAIPLYFESGYSITSDHVHDFVPPWSGLHLVSLENNVFLDE